ncbi:MAG: PIN-like domain-containing protein [Gordonia sp. (in: high G+C Gram-positive bacteria)]|uniref:PIN-like domain-containing protein n=1 Tax=Gordonia sp. (in: high G+C Gram-positive bacteria) TaxID=84139 RepID=UPI0039E37748
MAANIYTDFFEQSDPDLHNDVDTARAALYAIDTNILIDLYRYNEDTALQYLKALGAMRGNIFVPHQTIKEFWAVRDQVRRGTDHEASKGEVRSAARSLNKAVEKWGRRSTINGSPEIIALKSEVESIADRIISYIDENSTHQVNGETDFIVSGLYEALGDQVGEAPTEQELTKLRSEFEARIKKNQETPGSADLDKGAERAPGDYIIWQQCLAEAARRSANGEPVDLTIATSETKGDWVRSDNGINAGSMGDGQVSSLIGSPQKRARRYLVREYHDRVGGTLRLVGREGLLEIADKVFEAAVSDEAKQQVQETTDEIWTYSLVETYMADLRSMRSLPQLRVLIATAVSAATGRFIGIFKSSALELANREDLRGFIGAYQTPLRRRSFVELNENGITDPPISYSRGDESFVMDQYVAQLVIEVAESNPVYAAMLDQPRSWVKNWIAEQDKGSEISRNDEME